ncbi:MULTISPECIES: aspartate dehydrogenase [Cohnella]|uniref:aspartate dehydrogenase n=1 Tax=Cohnella TaxID=329857 RepID=UPI0009BB7A27|nr:MULTISPECIES: aspartate dehydrogenase [Cohnella]MBN2982490.1 aspartate dehydrogenase [Cohnella algarum]
MEQARVGLIGFGAIGRDIAAMLGEGKAGRARLVGILVRNPDKVRKDEAGDGVLVTNEAAELWRCRPDIVVECAGHAAVRGYAEAALAEGAHLIVVSAGALADEALLARLTAAAAEAGRQVLVPSAAIGGLDRIAAASLGPMGEVRLVTRKPPAAWIGTPVERQIDLASLSEPVCVFEGAAREAARRFPESVNVSAALSLAGIGMDATRVSVHVDPTISHNAHRIEAEGTFGRIELEVRNAPSAANPKTGVIVAMSVVKAIRQFTAPIVIGI